MIKIVLLFQSIICHMDLRNPTPRGSKYNSKEKQIDYSINSPLGAEKPYPCQGKPRGEVVKTYKAGEKMEVEIGGEALHNGGHCQFALSRDDKTFVVFSEMRKNCLVNSRKYKLKIPKNTPSGQFTFAWTWINKTGNREYYMNCADIKIDGNPNGKIKGPELLVVNYKDKKIPEFTNGGYDGKDLFDARKYIVLDNKLAY